MLVTSFFSFSYNVFKRRRMQGRENSRLYGDRLMHFQKSSNSCQDMDQNFFKNVTQDFYLFPHCFPMLNGLTHYHILLTTQKKKALENTVGTEKMLVTEKDKMLVTSTFSFPHSVFYSIKEKIHHFSNH